MELHWQDVKPQPSSTTSVRFSGIRSFRFARPTKIVRMTVRRMKMVIVRTSQGPTLAVVDDGESMTTRVRIPHKPRVMKVKTFLRITDVFEGGSKTAGET